MKKYISGFLVVLGLLIYFPARADVPSNTFFLGDGKGYDVNGVQTYFCLADSNCYDITGVFAFIKQAQTDIADLQNKVDSLQNTVNQLQQPAPANEVVATSTPQTFNDLEGIDIVDQLGGSTTFGNLTTSIPVTLTVYFYPHDSALDSGHINSTLYSDYQTALLNDVQTNPQNTITYTTNTLGTKFNNISNRSMGLESNSKYYYRIELTDAQGNKYEGKWNYDSSLVTANW